MVMADASAGRSLAIHYLRALAAIMIVAYHVFTYQFLPVDNIAQVAWLSRGVAIFFVISGFVIVSSTAKSPHQPLRFLQRRIIRVVPLYWLPTLALILAFGGRDGSHLLKSLLFLPIIDGETGQALWPVLDPGWTLNFEMAFYALFALFMLLPRPIAIWLLAALLAILPAVPLFVSLPPALAYYTSPLLLNFAAGMLIAHLGLRAPVWMLPLGFLLLIVTPSWPDLPALSIILPATLIVASARAFDPSLPTWRVPLLLGDASYAIYLSHIFVMFLILPDDPPATILAATLMLLSLMLASIALGVVVHLLIEKPLSRLLRGKRPSFQAAGGETQKAAQTI